MYFMRNEQFWSETTISSFHFNVNIKIKHMHQGKNKLFSKYVYGIPTPFLKVDTDQEITPDLKT